MCSFNLAVLIPVVVVLAVQVEFMNANLLASIKRSRRNFPENVLAWKYWNTPVSMGVYINNDYPGDAEATVDSRTYKRTMPSEKEGSGSGSGTPVETGKRSKVPKPEEHKDEEHKTESFNAEKKSELSANVSHIEEMSDDDGTKKTTTITCQGQKEWLQCPMYRLIKINSAFWGRDDTKTCERSGVEHGLKTDKICAQDESNTMTKVQNACDGESACELVASPVYFDRTDCPDIYKFMRVNWECAHSESRIKETIEGEKEEIARHMASIDEPKKAE